MIRPKVFIHSGVDPKVVSKLPRLSVDQWRKIASAKPRIVTDAAAAAAIKEHRTAADKNLATLMRVYKPAPAALARLGVKDGKVGPANAAPSITFTGKDKKGYTFRTLTRDAMVHDALVARALLSSRTNKAQVYAAALQPLLGRAKTDRTLADKIKGFPQAIDATKTAIRHRETDRHCGPVRRVECRGPEYTATRPSRLLRTRGRDGQWGRFGELQRGGSA
jgi:hypothetical protein